MNEYALLAASAAISATVNALGAVRGAAGGSLRRVLVVKLDHLGDVVTATPALRALRDAYPAAHIDLLVAPTVAALFEGGPLANRVLTYDSPRYRRGAAPLERASLRALRGERYDVIVELRGDWRTLLLPLRVGAIRRLDRGTVRVRDWLRRRLRKHSVVPHQTHEVEANYEVVRPLLGGGALPSPPATEVHVSFPAHESLEWRLAEADVDPRRPIVVIHPGAFWRPRAWLPDRFAAMADWVAEHYDAQVVLIGSADEQDVEAAVRSRVGKARALSMFGTLTLPELAALLTRSTLLIGNDSGIAHLAAACGTPTVALFGPQDPRRFRPWSDKAIALHHPVPCFPCTQIRCVRPELPCVNLIEISEVQAAVQRLLGAPVSLHRGPSR
jgi:predicted lipopolysaccharide heptosyltransferase III